MDLLYSRYASPLELLDLYISQGRFGEFVRNIIELENERKAEEDKKEEDKKLWSLYLFNGSGKSFIDWKAEVLENSRQRVSKGKDENLTDSDIMGIINNVFPERK